MTVTPGLLLFGARGDDDVHELAVTAGGTWGAYVSASWIKINGGSTISSGGNGRVTVGLGTNIPSGQPDGVCPGSTVTTGTITLRLQWSHCCNCEVSKLSVLLMRISPAGFLLMISGAHL